MRHRIAGKNLSRTTAHLVALRRNMASSLFEHGRITTTLAKARHVRPFAEKLITLARKGTLHARRLVIARLQDRDLYDPETDKFVGTAVRKLFEEIAPKYADRPGGYTRIVRTSSRRVGDGSELVVLQLIDPGEPARKKPSNVTPRRRRAKARYAFAERRASGRKVPAARTEEPADQQPAEGDTVQADIPADSPVQQQGGPAEVDKKD